MDNEPTFSVVWILVVLVAVVGLVSPAAVAVQRVPLGVVGDQAEPGHDDCRAHREGRHHHEHLQSRRKRRGVYTSLLCTLYSIL